MRWRARRNNRLVGLLGLFAAASALALGFHAARISRHQRADGRLLEARLISPEVRREQGMDLAESPPLKYVEFLYELRNLGTRPLHPLPPILFCQCALTRTLPEQINPGQTTTIGFRFQAPQAGTRRERVLLPFAETPDKTLVMLPGIRTALNPPCILFAPEVLNLSMPPGNPETRDILIHTMERAGSPHFLRGLTSNSPGLISSTLAELQEHPAQDAGSVDRTYHYQLSFSPLEKSAEAIRAVLTIDTEGSERRDNAETRDIIVQIEPLKPLALVPNTITFSVTPGQQSPTRKVMVIRRKPSPEGPIELKEFDSELLHIRKSSETLADREIFEISVRPGVPPATRSTMVIFGSQESDLPRLELPVHFFFHDPGLTSAQSNE